MKTRNRVRNVALFERVQSFLINNYSSTVSVPSIVEALENEGIKTKAQTVRTYIQHLQHAKIIYECNRFDLKSKKALAREQKFYLADLSLYFSTNTDNQLNYGPSLENIVYLYLVSCGYKVSIGKIGNFECDFIVRKPGGSYAYVQVSYSLHGKDARATKKSKSGNTGPSKAYATATHDIS